LWNVKLIAINSSSDPDIEYYYYYYSAASQYYVSRCGLFLPTE